MKVKELIRIVLDSPFYLEMSLQERKEYVDTFVTLYIKRTVPGHIKKKGGK
jgi:hypothetical protein